MDKVKNIEHKVEDEIKKDVNLVAEKTHMKPWMVLAILGVIVLVIIGLIGWCIYRFFKKKRPKGAEDKDKQDDENALVDNEEANVEEVEEANQEEAKGRIRYRLEYDFTLQELKVTVIEAADLPATDWSTGLTDPLSSCICCQTKSPNTRRRCTAKISTPNSIRHLSSKIFLMWIHLTRLSYLLSMITTGFPLRISRANSNCL